MIISREYIKKMQSNRKLPFPYLIQLEITDMCPFTCPQCYKKSVKKDIDSRHMEFERLKEVIEYCYRNGTRFFVLNGGEPMLYPKIKELILFLKTMDIHVNCFTSGYGVSEEIIQIWDFEKHRLCLSLNGSTKEMNSMTRQGFDITIDVMKKLSVLKKNYGINWVARHDNLKGLRDLLTFCEKYSVKYLYVTSEKLTGEGKLMSPLTKEDMFMLAKVIREYSGEIEIITESCFPTLGILTKNSSNSNYFMGCFAGKYGCHINVDFQFSPCTHLPYFEEHETLKEYWDNSRVIQDINNSLENPHCGDCVHQKLCNPCKAWNRDMFWNLSSDYYDCSIYNCNTKGS